MYCLKLTESSVEKNVESIVRHADEVSFAELGISSPGEFTSGEIEWLIDRSPVPVIVADYGGGRAAAEILLAAAGCGAGCVETGDEESADRIARSEELRAGGGRLIRRLEFPEGLPGDLRKRVEASRGGGAIVKVVAPISGMADALAFVRGAEELAGIEEKLLLGEGEAGLFSRILYRRFGSLWTYAVAGGSRTADAEDRAASETPALRELTEVYGASEIGRETKLLGIIGNPVAHSRSPLIHNGWLRDAGLNAVYLPFLVDDPGAFFRLAEALPVDGFSVTVPHKQAVISELDELDPAVRKIGACNTVYRGPMGWHGTNTDYEGFLSPLLGLLERGAIRRCLVVGAGGAARTAAHALNDRGVEVNVCNRTVEKAVRIAAETGGTGMSPEDAPEAGPYDLIVQTTSVGMEPHTEEDPLPAYRFSGAETVYDVIYTPEVTRIMQRARQVGCTTIGGAEMLRTQAEAQFRIFTGGLSPRDR